jgi:hypothetical protein
LGVVVGPATAGGSRVAAPRALVSALLGTLLLLAGSVVAGQRLADTFTPSNAVLAWYEAQRAGDAGAAWADADYGRGALVSRARLAAMLALPANRDWSDVRVLDTQQDGPSHYRVEVAYRHAGKAGKAVLGVRREEERRYLLFPYWRVEVPPARLTVAGVAPGGRLSLDGAGAASGALLAATAVIPGHHVLAETATSVTEATSLAVDVQAAAGATLRPAVTKAMQSAARAQLEDAFSGCARSADLRPGGCPISTYRMGDVVTDVSWTEEGDQLAGASFAAGAEPGLVSVTGSWRMHVAYDYAYLGLEDSPDHREADESGRWQAVFRKAAAGLQLVSFEAA